MLHCSWDMVSDRCNYFSFWAVFCPFTPQQPKKPKFWKNEKKMPGDIIILHMCTNNYDQMMYDSWYMVRDGCNYFSFWAIFCHFTPQQPKKPKFWKNEKKCLEIISFYIGVPKIIIKWCTVPEKWCVADVIISNFRLFFALIPP